MIGTMAILAMMVTLSRLLIWLLSRHFVC